VGILALYLIFGESMRSFARTMCAVSFSYIEKPFFAKRLCKIYFEQGLTM
jgi:hypothetical protein